MKRMLVGKLQISALLLASVLGITGILSVSARAADAPAAGTFRAYMANVVGPATQPIWDLGYAERVTDADWDRLKKASADLVGSMPTIGTGGFSAAEQARGKTPTWQDWTKKMAAAANDAKAAVDGKNQMALAAAGDTLLEICSGCHMQFDPTAK